MLLSFAGEGTGGLGKGSEGSEQQQAQGQQVQEREVGRTKGREGFSHRGMVPAPHCQAAQQHSPKEQTSYSRPPMSNPPAHLLLQDRIGN